MKEIITSLIMFVLLTILAGGIYPLFVWGVAQTFFSYQANGSLIKRDGKVIGSELIGQNFTSPKYFHGRPSAAGAGYDATASGGSNLGPTSDKLITRIKTDAENLQAYSPGKPVPADLVTTSASGLDPEISPAAADFQVAAVAKARGMREADVRALVSRFTKGRQLGFLGERRVNVLLLNLALDGQDHVP
ncbi:MAG: potassium-transporting ATPase subunit KdpC [Acidobacteria bacterium]|nr:potassium-transporting ATPase subunit KdpC [Acidobacteriota bacterium]